jgi:hypothetical protein
VLRKPQLGPILNQMNPVHSPTTYIFTYLFTHSLTHSLIHSMVQDIIWKADCHSTCQEYSAFFMESEGALKCSQKPATSSYPQPAESSSPDRS